MQSSMTYIFLYPPDKYKYLFLYTSSSAPLFQPRKKLPLTSAHWLVQNLSQHFEAGVTLYRVNLFLPRPVLQGRRAVVNKQQLRSVVIICLEFWAVIGQYVYVLGVVIERVAN